MTSLRWLSTMSRTVNLGNALPGCCRLLDGEEETPLPSASTAMTKYRELSMSFPGPIFLPRSSDVPIDQVSISTALPLAASSLPKVRYPTWQSRMTSPLSSFKSPRSAVFCARAQPSATGASRSAHAQGLPRGRCDSAGPAPSRPLLEAGRDTLPAAAQGTEAIVFAHSFRMTSCPACVG